MGKAIELRKLKGLLNEKVLLYDRPGSIPTDPVSVPHRFSKNPDIELAGIPAAQRHADGLKDSLIRLSVGIEHADDLIADLESALANV